MKTKEIRDLSRDEIKVKVEESEKELFNLRLQQSIGQLEKPSRLREVRRLIAKLKTVANQKSE